MSHVPGHQDPMPPEVESISTLLIGIILTITGALLAVIGINFLKYSSTIKNAAKTDVSDDHLN